MTGSTILYVPISRQHGLSVEIKNTLSLGNQYYNMDEANSSPKMDDHTHDFLKSKAIANQGTFPTWAEFKRQVYSNKSSGVFVGINSNTIDNHSNPDDLKWAQADAIAVAHLFVTAGAINPKRCHVILGGKTNDTDSIKAKSSDLKKAGVTFSSQTTSLSILDLLETAANEHDPERSLLVFYISGHGFQSGPGQPDIALLDTSHPDDKKYELCLQTDIIDILQLSKASLKTVIWDTCRIRSIINSKSNSSKKAAPSEKGSDWDKNGSQVNFANGIVIYWPSGFGEPTYECNQLQHSVCAHFLTASRNDPNAHDRIRKYISVSSLYTYLDTACNEYLSKSRHRTIFHQQWGTDSEHYPLFFPEQFETRLLELGGLIPKARSTLINWCTIHGDNTQWKAAFQEILSILNNINQFPWQDFRLIDTLSKHAMDFEGAKANNASAVAKSWKEYKSRKELSPNALSPLRRPSQTPNITDSDLHCNGGFVTKTAFNAFVTNEGYSLQHEAIQRYIWTEVGYKWLTTHLKENRTPEPPGLTFSSPYDGKSPVLGICWFEAVAFCNWCTLCISSQRYRIMDIEKMYLSAAKMENGKPFQHLVEKQLAYPLSNRTDILQKGAYRVPTFAERDIYQKKQTNTNYSEWICDPQTPDNRKNIGLGKSNSVRRRIITPQPGNNAQQWEIPRTRLTNIGFRCILPSFNPIVSIRAHFTS